MVMPGVHSAAGGGAAVVGSWGHGFGNIYYAAAIRSMASSWYNFLYASFAAPHNDIRLSLHDPGGNGAVATVFQRSLAGLWAIEWGLVWRLVISFLARPVC